MKYPNFDLVSMLGAELLEDLRHICAHGAQLSVKFQDYRPGFLNSLNLRLRLCGIEEEKRT